MTQLFLLFSHKLTSDQIYDAKETLKVDNYSYLPESLQLKWSNVDPAGNLDTQALNEIGKWLQKEGSKGDLVLIQGDFGATFYMVDLCLKKGFVPIYATTKRVSEEKQNAEGIVERKQLFKHVGFRRYELYR